MEPARTQLELLAPARDLACGRAAIDGGADAVYIGAERFGAREAAGNTVADIETLAHYAHRYWARVYVTLNTLLRDEEFPQALRLIRQVYEAGADGLIIQDMGLLECDLPPIALIASTQTDNRTPEKVAFLERVGFQRAILARELSLTQIRAIRQRAPAIELECFVFGALCVSYSGQCYLSYALGGRSGNRGACAQPCRKGYDLVDSRGRHLGPRKHYLSLRDLNLSDHLGALVEAGVTSFKIEGRLKDRLYVANAVAHFRRELDRVIEAKGLDRASAGTVTPSFTPAITKTFNRGFTTYFLHGRATKIGSRDTPKMMGESIGRVKRIDRRGVTLDSDTSLHPGDGICFFDAHDALAGTTVNAVDGTRIVVEKTAGLKVGTTLYRNHDHAFLTQLKKARPQRKIHVVMALRETDSGICLAVKDENGNRAQATAVCDKEAAHDMEQAQERLRAQLRKTGQTPFVADAVHVECETVYFLPVSVMNSLRREVLERLEAVRQLNRPITRRSRKDADGGATPYPFGAHLPFQANVLNSKASDFYRRHGVETIEPAAESGLDMRARQVMTLRHCLKDELGFCHKSADAKRVDEPLLLIDEAGNRLRLEFDCAACEMRVWMEPERTRSTQVSEIASRDVFA